MEQSAAIALNTSPPTIQLSKPWHEALSPVRCSHLAHAQRHAISSTDIGLMIFAVYSSLALIAFGWFNYYRLSNRQITASRLVSTIVIGISFMPLTLILNAQVWTEMHCTGPNAISGGVKRTMYASAIVGDLVSLLTVCIWFAACVRFRHRHRMLEKEEEEEEEDVDPERAISGATTICTDSESPSYGTLARDCVTPKMDKEEDLPRSLASNGILPTAIAASFVVRYGRAMSNRSSVSALRR